MRTFGVTAKIASLLVLGALLSGCSSDQPSPPVIKSAIAPIGHSQTNSRAPVLANHQLNLPANSQELLGRLSVKDRKLVESFYGNYGESVLTFDNPREFEWMERHGYPMPDDVLQASRKSDAELREQFELGDPKAGFFLLDRITNRSDSVLNADESLFAERVLAVESPFSGYAYYHYYSGIKGEWAVALSGLLWADFRGDWRAKGYFRQLVNTGGPFQEKLGPGSIPSAYQSLLATIRLSNPSLLSRPIDPRNLYWAGRR